MRIGAGVEQQETDAFDRLAIGARANVEQRLFKSAIASFGVEATVSEVTEPDSDTQSFALVSTPSAITWDGADDPLDPKRGVRAGVTATPVVGSGDTALAYVVSTASAAAYQRVVG